MRAIGVRESLGGPWSFNTIGWLVLFFPSTVLVILQESATPYPHFGYVLLSAVAQHVVAGIISLPAVVFLRRPGRQLPIWCSFIFWTGIGLTRGLVGGLLALWVAGVDPNFGPRMTLWLLVSWVWMPLFSYTAAQSENRRSLLGGLDDAVKRRDAAISLRDRSADDIRAELVRAVQSAVNGAIDEIRTSLDAARSSLDPDQLRLVGDHLASVSHQVGSVVDRLAKPVRGEAHSTPHAGAPLLAALTFERRRPWFSSALSSAALIAILVPVCLNLQDWAFLVTLFGAMLVSTCVLALGAHITLPGLTSLRRQVAWVVARYGAAGLCAAVVLTVIQWNNLDAFTTVLILVLPYGVAFSAMVVSGAVGLAAANRRALRSFAAIESERQEIETAAEAEENSIRDQLAQVMHGPVLGRLAACAMALNFHAADVGIVPDERTEELARAVAAHLDAATADLDSLVH